MASNQYPVIPTPDFSRQIAIFAGEHASELEASIQFLLSRRPRHGADFGKGIRAFTTSESSVIGRSVVTYEFDGEAVYLLGIKPG